MANSCSLVHKPFNSRDLELVFFLAKQLLYHKFKCLTRDLLVNCLQTLVILCLSFDLIELDPLIGSKVSQCLVVNLIEEVSRQ